MNLPDLPQSSAGASGEPARVENLRILNSAMNKCQGKNTEGRPVVAAFDFDVTMTYRDTFVPFLNRAFGRHKVLATFLRLAPDAVKVMVGLSDRDDFKRLLVHDLFGGMSVKNLREDGFMHAKEIINWLRPDALARIRWHKEQNHRLIMVSASLNLYLEPICKELGFDDLLCTCLSIDHNVFDGGLVGNNCRGVEKLKRLERLLGDLSCYEIHAYGDSSGDREMLDAANFSYYKTF